MDHPIVLEIQRTGYPYGYENDFMGEDSLGNEIYKGDVVYVLNDEYFLADRLVEETKEVLEMLGAVTKCAE